MRPFNHRIIRRQELQQKENKIFSCLKENLKKLMLVHVQTEFNIIVLSCINQMKILTKEKKQIMNNLRSNCEYVLGYDISQQLNYFQTDLNSLGISYQGALSFRKIKNFILKQRILFYVNQR